MPILAKLVVAHAHCHCTVALIHLATVTLIHCIGHWYTLANDTLLLHFATVAATVLHWYIDGQWDTDTIWPLLHWYIVLATDTDWPLIHYLYIWPLLHWYIAGQWDLFTFLRCAIVHLSLHCPLYHTANNTVFSFKRSNAFWETCWQLHQERGKGTLESGWQKTLNGNSKNPFRENCCKTYKNNRKVVQSFLISDIIWFSCLAVHAITDCRVVDSFTHPQIFHFICFFILILTHIPFLNENFCF